MATRTDDPTLDAAAGWAESVARNMREAADRLDEVAEQVRYADDTTAAGRYVAAVIRDRVAGVVIGAYDVQACAVCGDPAQWHDHATTDHYPQNMVTS